MTEEDFDFQDPPEEGLVEFSITFRVEADHAPELIKSLADIAGDKLVVTNSDGEIIHGAAE